MNRRIISLLAFFSVFVSSLLLQPAKIVYAQGNGVVGLPSVLRGTVEVFGVARHDAFRKWQLDILINGDERQAAFVAVSEQPLNDVAKLASIDTSLFPDGEHKLRLRVAYTGLQYDEYFTPIRISNSGLAEDAQIPDENVPADAELEESDSEDAQADLEQVEKKPVVDVVKAAKPVIEYDPNNYLRTLEVGSGYFATEPISRNATRKEIEAAQAVDVVQLKTDVPPGVRRIEVDLSEQKLIAYQGDVVVMETQVSTGKKNGKEKLMYYTETVTGRYTMQRRYEYTRMIGPGYDTANVPYAQFFFRGYAIHGAYWHNEFGTPVSHGCINMRVEEARQLFEWADIGTEIIITD